MVIDVNVSIGGLVMGERELAARIKSLEEANDYFKRWEAEAVHRVKTLESEVSDLNKALLQLQQRLDVVEFRQR
jgi:prefoldin subunit 5